MAVQKTAQARQEALSPHSNDLVHIESNQNQKPTKKLSRRLTSQELAIHEEAEARQRRHTEKLDALEEHSKPKVKSVRKSAYYIICRNGRDLLCEIR